MKKILMLAALPLIILLFGSKSYCATDLELQTFINVLNDQYNTSIEINTDNKAIISGFLDDLKNHDNNSLVAWLEQTGNLVCNSAVVSYRNTTVFLTGPYLQMTIVTNQSGFPTIISTEQTSNTNYNNKPNYHDFGHYNDFMIDPIDWDTIYYNPQIPVPKLNIWYLYQVESYREDGVANFTANIDVPDSTEFYVELAWKYSYPQNIRVYSSDTKGTPAYDYELYQSSDLISIYALQDMQQAINLHITGSSLQTAWQAAYDDFIDGVTFYTNQSNAPANWLSTARLNYVNKMATQIPLYGNRLEVFARYWTLSEDNQVVVGKWYHWQSAKGSATEEIPQNYVNYQELPGYAGTVENVPIDDESTYTGTGETTGEQATTVINYAPNYPDYPTAVSYNHDNILLQMIQTSKQLPQFFGQFTNFLAITLAFIDPGVWAIIGFGFTCCIVIMIIKVL